MQWLTNTINDAYDWVMRRLAKRVMNEAYADGQNSALRVALVQFDRARRDDHLMMLMDIRKIGESIPFNDADPKVAYNLGKQVAIEIIENRSK